ncbi:MAG: carbamate kinase [Candidatus Diapherotrites archaeon]
MAKGREKVLVALGGNALIREHQLGKYAEQMRNVRRTCRLVAKIVKRGHDVIVTHGNGPQVGNLQVQMQAAKCRVPAMPLDVSGAMTQAQVGYMLQQALSNYIRGRDVATVITQVEVDAHDSAFRNPTKPIGQFYSAREAKALSRKFKMVEDAGRGWRRVVASPRPKRIVELPTIRKLSSAGAIVVACGGGGIPVVKGKEGYKGVEAVIDKDHASALLANSLGIKTMAILTGIEFVMVDYRKKSQRKLRGIHAKELRKYLREGQFPEGSMKPKIEAALDFLSKGGKKVIITSLNKLVEGLEGKTGTIITK